jgi:ribosomal protein S18 acetylase RimI-like enzyme
MEIRFLTADDAAAWSRLRLDALEKEPAAFNSSLEEHRVLALEEISRRLSGAPDSFVVGAFEENTLVGIAGFHRETGPKTRHKGRIWGVYVTASNRGHGISRRLMDALLDRVAGIAGVEQVLLSVTNSQAAALSLYRSLGFEVFGTEPRALNINGDFVDEHYLILTLRKGRQKPSRTLAPKMEKAP